MRLKAPLSESPLLESYMLVWSTFLTAVLAATDTTINEVFAPLVMA